MVGLVSCGFCVRPLPLSDLLRLLERQRTFSDGLLSEVHNPPILSHWSSSEDDRPRNESSRNDME